MIAVAAALALGSGAACASATTTTTTITPPLSSPESLAESPAAGPPGHTELAGGRYLTVGGLDMTIDAFVPDGPGPWPVVVVFHGKSGAFKDAASNTAIARGAAESGMLAFTPTWIAGDPFPLVAADLVDLRYAASCAVAFSQQWAVELGGDPANTVVYGFSAGAGPALAATVAPLAAVPGCETEMAPEPVVGAVLGDGEYFYQSPPFDTAFGDDLAAMQTEVARLTDRNRWPTDLDAEIYIWAAEDGTAPRPLDDPAAPNWLDDRDPDGSILADLVRLGRVEDGVVDYVDAAHFIEGRLRMADLETELRIFPGGHTVDDKVGALVEAIASVGLGG